MGLATGRPPAKCRETDRLENQVCWAGRTSISCALLSLLGGNLPEGLIERNVHIFAGANLKREMEVPFRIVLYVKLAKAIRVNVGQFLEAAQKMDVQPIHSAIGSVRVHNLAGQRAARRILERLQLHVDQK